MNFYTTLSNIGTAYAPTDSIKQKAILANQLAFASSVVVLPYIVLYAVVYPPMAVFYLFEMLLGLSVLYFNGQRMYDAARLTIVFVPFVSVYISSAFVVSQQISQQFPLGLMMLIFAIGLMVFLFIELKEIKYWLVIAPVYCFVLIFPDSLLVAFEKKDVDLSFLVSPIMNYTYRATGVAVCVIILYLFINNNEKFQKENVLLIAEMNQRTQEQHLLNEKANLYIKQIETNQILEKQREWASNGLVKFSEIIRENSQDTSHLYSILTSTLVNYLGANQAGIFILELQNEQEVLVLKGAYAYNRKKYLDKTIEIGQGLIGQCIFEKQPVFLTQIPQNYLQINSGLGQAAPNCILIQPLIIDGKVFGAVELASFEILPDYKRNFLGDIGQVIASAISTIQTNEQTKALLAASREQAAQMREQEEELRQNMEELSATQEQMERKEREISQLLEISEQKNNEISIVSLKHKNEYETLASDYKILEVKNKRKDKKILELETKINNLTV